MGPLVSPPLPATPWFPPAPGPQPLLALGPPASRPPSDSVTDIGTARYSYSDELGKWMEVGNSGMFRPEMLRPMGLPEDVSVIAWGLSLER